MRLCDRIPFLPTTKLCPTRTSYRSPKLPDEVMLAICWAVVIAGTDLLTRDD